MEVRLAQTKEEFESAYHLIQKSRVLAGLGQASDELWLTKHHALPSTNTIVAIHKGEVIAAVCLVGDSSFHLPMEDSVKLDNFRLNLVGRVAEISMVGIHSNWERDKNVVPALFHYAVCFGSTYCDYQAFVLQATNLWRNHWAEKLQLETLLTSGSSVQGLLALNLNTHEGVDFRKLIEDVQVQFRFPEKKIFLVAQQSMPPEIMNYLFNVKTNAFSKLNDNDLRVLKNIYDFGEYAKILPDRPLAMPYKQLPKRPRFPMNCEGYLCNGSGEKIHLQVLDVSREGLKVRTEDNLKLGESYPLTLAIGVNKLSEVIASAVWCDELAQIAGLQVHSGDVQWQQLIEHLEKNYLKPAA